MTHPGVGYAVIKGEAISKSNNYRIKIGHPSFLGLHLQLFNCPANVGAASAAFKRLCG